MRKIFPVMILLFALIASSCSQETSLEIFATTDLHGMLLPFDNTEGTATDRSLANLASLVAEKGNENIVLLDNGDILQGDPLTYYYNFEDTVRTHIVPDILNHLGYDAQTAGNHDIETGHQVYDRVRRESNYPVLAANAISISTGKPYFEPYTVIRKKGLKIVVFGLITPSVPNWLPASLYSGIRFEGMVETAKKWMPEMQALKPDIIIGLFHSGLGDERRDDDSENSTLAVAEKVPGFDVIFCGHDHSQDVRKVASSDGDSVLVLDGGSRASVLMSVMVTFDDGGGKPEMKSEGRLIPMNSLAVSGEFTSRYSGVSDTIREYTSRVLGRSDAAATTRDSFFGPSAFVDLIHEIQTDITGADISFAAPLSFDEQIGEGEIRVRDLFRLYRFENFLYTVSMKGSEIDRYLEHSCGMWMNTMKNKGDLLLLYRTDEAGKPVMTNGRPRLRNASYNFDSAMGIKYTVDVTKPQGDRVTINSLSSGAPFSADSTYTVAVNSYRASGGGGHMAAAGLSQDEVNSRIISSTGRDLRYYMAGWITDRKVISPRVLTEWKIIPAEWAAKASQKEKKMLFNGNNK